MKGKTLVIGLVVFVLVVVAAIYFAVMAEFDRDKPADTNVEIVD
ncbi:hypothetical protein [Sporosarcina sp. SAFN-015]